MDINVGQIIKTCEDSLCTQLMQLENSFEPCDLDTAKLYLDLSDKYTENLIQRLNRVTESFVENTMAQYENNVNLVMAQDRKNNVEISDEENNMAHGNAMLKVENTMNDGPVAAVNVENVGERVQQEWNDTLSETGSFYDANELQRVEMNGSATAGTSAINGRNAEIRISQKRNKSHVVNSTERSKGMRCEVCKKDCKRKDRLAHHRRIHLDLHPIHCRICFHIFESKLKKMTHENKCQQKRFECYVCGKNFLYNNILREHIRIHTDITPYSCSICKVKRLKAIRNYNNHESRCKLIKRNTEQFHKINK